jgi:hypothetical protein
MDSLMLVSGLWASQPGPDRPAGQRCRPDQPRTGS